MSDNGILSIAKRNEQYSHEETWRKFKCILLSERHWSEKAVDNVIQTAGHLEKAKLWRQLRDQSTHFYGELTIFLSLF